MKAHERQIRDNRHIAYVEWPSDEPKEIPNWCPLRNKQ